MGANARGVPIERTMRLEKHEYQLFETDTGAYVAPRGFVLGGVVPVGGTTIKWAVDVKVEGKRDSNCNALQFGFVQKVTLLNAYWKWGSSCERCRLKVPWWDVAAEANNNQSYWYYPQGIQFVSSGCFRESKHEAGIISQITHLDSPTPRFLPWYDPKQPKNSLTEFFYEAGFVTTLVQVSPTTGYQALLELPWSVLVIGNFDVSKPRGNRGQLLSSEISLKKVRRGGDSGVVLHHTCDVAANWKLEVVPCEAGK